MKASYGKGTKIDKCMTIDTIRSVLSEVRPGKFPKVTLVHGNMKSSEIAKLYKKEKINAYITATKGEGYGLPIIEAAASGMPVVATNWSGHLEFLKDNKFLGVDYNLEEVRDSKIDNRVFIKGSKWAKVSEKDFKKKIREVKDNYNYHKKNAVELQNYVHSNFSKEVIVKLYDKMMKEVINA